MITLKDVGGVQVFGSSADIWEDTHSRLIKGCDVEFNSDVCSPDVDNGNFIFPAHRGQYDYRIHLLEDGSALVIKEGRLYLCTNIDNMPRVLDFIPVPSDQKHSLLV